MSAGSSSSRFKLPPLRPWREFSAELSQPPQGKVSERISLNIQYYASCYYLIVLAALAVASLIEPPMLAVLFVTGGVGVCLSSYRQPFPGLNRPLQEGEKPICVAALALLLLSLADLQRSKVAIVLSALAILLHAYLRKAQSAAVIVNEVKRLLRLEPGGAEDNPALSLLVYYLLFALCMVMPTFLLGLVSPAVLVGSLVVLAVGWKVAKDQGWLRRPED